MKLVDRIAGRDHRTPGRFLPGSPVIDARDVTVSYDGVVALRGVDITVRAGEVTAIVGPNGAGKSTLLAAIAGDLPLDSGVVTIDGSDVGTWNTRELAVRRGVLLQQVGIAFPFTVAEVVRMGRSPWERTPAEDWDDVVVAETLLETDTAELIDRVYMSLSGGERARVALARVLAQEPVALLLDEPTASLDIRHQEDMLSLVRRRASRGDAVAVVLHDLGLAGAYSDVVVVLFDGEVAAAGPPEEVLTSELLSGVYDYPIDVIRHPNTGALLVLPQRGDTRGRDVR